MSEIIATFSSLATEVLDVAVSILTELVISDFPCALEIIQLMKPTLAAKTMYKCNPAIGKNLMNALSDPEHAVRFTYIRNVLE